MKERVTAGFEKNRKMWYKESAYRRIGAEGFYAHCPVR